MSYQYDPELAPYVPASAALDISSGEQIKNSRELIADAVAATASAADAEGVDVRDIMLPGKDGHQVPLRLYRPSGIDSPIPCLLHIHGGGFVMGSVEIVHRSSALLARELGVTVAAVEYRLAPEHPYPAGLEDCYSALLWCHAQADELLIDPARIAVYGQSAGGGLAAALALLSRDRSGPALCFQFLSIPELDDRLETPSMRTFTDTPFWTRGCAEHSWRHYLGSRYQAGSTEVPYYAAPSRAEDLRDLPPAYISAMEFDPLRDEAIAYAQKLMQAGVSVELHCYPGTFHGSSYFAEATVSQRQEREMFEVLRRQLTG